MTGTTPKTLAEYLDQLRTALRGADPALVQDALYDAEEHVRAEMAEHPGVDEATLIAKIAGSYGAPEEVAEIYRDQEIRITRALRPPPLRPRTSALGRFFGVAADPRAYSALFYMLLAFVTGMFYFTWVVTGISMSAGLAVLIIGVPFIVLFFGSVRVLSLVEGRIVETMLGERMPRRPSYPERDMPLLRRIGAMFADPRTWSTLFYMILMLPLGVLYFVCTVVWLSVSIAFAISPIVYAVTGWGILNIDDVHYGFPLWAEPFTFVLGVLLLFLLLHFARGVGHVHGQIAKTLLVKAAG